MKKAIACLLTALMMSCCLVACASEPATPVDIPALATTDTPKEPANEPVKAPVNDPVDTETEEPAGSLYPLCAPGEITLEWFAGDKTNQVLQMAESDFSQNVFYQRLEELTGVHIQWNILSGDTYNEQFSLMLVSEEYPDICTNDPAKCAASADQAYTDGILIRLNDYEELIPNYLAALDTAVGGYKGALTDAGNLLGFYQLRDRVQPSFLGYYTRQDWMDDLGLGAPETIADWEEMLVAFRDHKTGGKGPLLLTANGLPTFNFITRAFDVNGTAPYMIQRDGEVACTVVEDGFRQYLETMSRWYADNLIVQDFAANPNLNELLDANEAGVFMTMFRWGATFLHDTYGICEESFYAQKLKHPTLEEGGKNMIGDVAAIEGAAFTSGALIFAECAHIEEACQMLDYIYSEEGTLHANWGWEGEHFAYDENGKPQYLEWMFDPDKGTNREIYLIHSRPKVDLMDGIEAGLDETALDYYEYWNDVGEWNMPNVTYSVEEGEERTTIQNDVATYVEEFTLKVIVGETELNDDTWNAFVKALKDMGVDRMTEITQQAFDRFMSR